MDPKRKAKADSKKEEVKKEDVEKDTAAKLVDNKFMPLSSGVASVDEYAALSGYKVYCDGDK